MFKPTDRHFCITKILTYLSIRACYVLITFMLQPVSVLKMSIEQGMTESTSCCFHELFPISVSEFCVHTFLLDLWLFVVLIGRHCGHAMLTINSLCMRCYLLQLITSIYRFCLKTLNFVLDADIRPWVC